ncbi:hypothetical protein HY969_03060 [Candidatus Kaiserbacteria bacterium]|nr:hypothetical protein [Candidatus Kaiserbacteria bacterium]
MINSSEPKPQGETIPGLPQDLQLVGRYFLSKVKDVEFEIGYRERDKRAIEVDPTEEELDIEEEAKIFGMNKKELAAEKEQRLNPDKLQEEIDDLRNEREYYLGLLDGLKKGEFKPCIDYLRQSLEAKELAKSLITFEHTSPQYKEKSLAETRVLREYIRLLESK